MGHRTKRFAGVLWAFVIFIAAIIASAQAPKASDDPDQKEIYAYILTMDKIHELEHVRTALGLLTEQTSNALQHDASFTESTFTQRTKILEVIYPEVTAIILKQEMLTRECLLANHVLLRTLMLVNTKRRGEIQQSPDAEGDVNPANLTLVERHMEEVRKSVQGIRFKM